MKETEILECRNPGYWDGRYNTHSDDVLYGETMSGQPLDKRFIHESKDVPVIENPKKTNKKKERKKECGNCIHISTPKGKTCYTLTRRLSELVRGTGKLFIPSNVIPALDEIAKNCKRYKDAQVSVNSIITETMELY